MTKENYLTSLRAIETECTNRKAALSRIFVQENAKASVGAIVADGMVIIKVQELKYISIGLIPSIVYYGIKLKKNFEPYKRDESENVHESNPNFRIIKK